MRKTLWRTVATSDAAAVEHRSQAEAYCFVGSQPRRAEFRVQFNKHRGGGWEEFALVTVKGPGWVEERLALAEQESDR
jgi:hypothetical protein